MSEGIEKAKTTVNGKNKPTPPPLLYIAGVKNCSRDSRCRIKLGQNRKRLSGPTLKTCLGSAAVKPL
jgi:hypothetical protein